MGWICEVFKRFWLWLCSPSFSLSYSICFVFLNVSYFYCFSFISWSKTGGQRYKGCFGVFERAMFILFSLLFVFFRGLKKKWLEIQGMFRSVSESYVYFVQSVVFVLFCGLKKVGRDTKSVFECLRVIVYFVKSVSFRLLSLSSFCRLFPFFSFLLSYIVTILFFIVFTCFVFFFYFLLLFFVRFIFSFFS